MRLDARDISYGVIVDRKLKPLLQEINFSIDNGSFAALMGPSGAGKSTLLDVLANRKRDGIWAGCVNTSGIIDDSSNRDFVYVRQDDFHNPHLTVNETLLFAARTRMAEASSQRDIENRVQYLLTNLGLRDVRDSFVGDSNKRGISGGQLKRLSIAVEIVSFPTILFIDEPTSGLDSSIAFEVMTAIKNFSKTHSCTCLTTIHQPSSSIFNLFDTIVLLSYGRLIYSGSPNNVIQYFTSVALGYDNSGYSNIADFCIDICSAALRPKLWIVDRTPKELQQLYLTSRNQEANSLPPSMPVPENKSHLANYNNQNKSYVSYRRFWIQFEVLVFRNWLLTLRDTSDLSARVIKNVVVGLLTSMLFYGQADIHPPFFTVVGMPTPSVMTASGLLYFMMMFSFLGNSQIIPLLCHRSIVYRRELDSSTYTTFAYWLAACLSDLPFIFLTQSLFVLSIYFTCKFPLELSYFTYVFGLLFLSNLASYFLMLWLAAYTRNAELSFSIFPMIFIFLCNFCGYSVNIKNIPVFWTWAKYISFARWVFEGLIINEFDRFHDVLPPLDQASTLSQSELVLKEFGFDNFNKYYSYGIILLNIFILSFFIYLALLPIKSKLRRYSLAQFLEECGDHNDCLFESTMKRKNSYQLISNANSNSNSNNSNSTNNKRGNYINNRNTSANNISSINDSEPDSMKKPLLSDSFNSIEITTPPASPASASATGLTQPPLLPPLNATFDSISKYIKKFSNSFTATTENNNNNINNSSLFTKHYSKLSETAENENISVYQPPPLTLGPINEASPPSLQRPVSPPPTLLPLNPVNYDTNNSISISTSTDSRLRIINQEYKNDYSNNTNDRSVDSLHIIEDYEVVFQNLSYSLGTRKAVSGSHPRPRRILDNLTGYFRSGELLGVLGTSGSGKSTLLDVLAGRKTMGTIEGVVLYNGQRMSRDMLHQFAYVMQDNALVAELNVRETLLFAARLRLGNRISDVARQRRVQEVMEVLGLEARAEVLIGSPAKRALSGGQVKRVSIGVELMAAAPIILMDEPTTGLDSATSAEVVAVIRRLAEQNRAVMCTIHQPSANIFAQFDRVLILADGKVIYFGTAKDALRFFTNSPFDFHIPQDANPADLILAIASCTIHKKRSSSSSSEGEEEGWRGSSKMVTTAELSSYYASSDLYRMLIEHISIPVAASASASASSRGWTMSLKAKRSPRGSLKEGNSSSSSGKETHGSPVRQRGSSWLGGMPTSVSTTATRYPTSTAYQTATLCHREALRMWRDPRAVFVTTTRHVLIAVFYGSLYWHISDGPTATPPSKYNDRLSMLFFSLTAMVLGHQQAIPSLFEGRLVFYRERGAGLYGCVPYWISGWSMKLLCCVVDVWIYSLILYSMAGLNHSTLERFLFFYLVVLLESIISLFGSQWIAAISPSAQSAISYFPISLFFSLAFSGYVVYIPQFSEWIRVWTPNLSFLRWGLQALVRNEFDGNKELVLRDYYIELLGFEDISKYECLPCLGIFIVLFALLLLLSLKYINFEMR